MSWQPAPESLQTLAACLKDSLSGFDKNAQKQAETVRYGLHSGPSRQCAAMLTVCAAHPDARPGETIS